MPGRIGLITLALAIGGCAVDRTPSPQPSPSASPTPRIATPAPTGSIEPPLSLALPLTRNGAVVEVTIAPAIPADGSGSLTIRVHNASDNQIRQLVVRWPTELKRSIFLAPFKPSRSRVEGTFRPLYVEWTKWVEGPGESGEPAGTTSLGWGPLPPGVTVIIKLVATRLAPGPLAFDLQLLSGESILILADDSLAEFRVELP